MNKVTWIYEDELHLEVDSAETARKITAAGFRVYLRNRAGSHSSRSESYRHLRFTRIDEFSPTVYTFTENAELFRICCLLNDLGFTFYSNFKTERAPSDYMYDLQLKGKLRKPFTQVDYADATRSVAPGPVEDREGPNL